MNLYERFIDFTKTNEIETRDLGHQREEDDDCEQHNGHYCTGDKW